MEEGGCVAELAEGRQHRGEKCHACVEPGTTPSWCQRAGMGFHAVGQVVPCPVADRDILLSTKLKLNRCSGF